MWGRVNVLFCVPAEDEVTPPATAAWRRTSNRFLVWRRWPEKRAGEITLDCFFLSLTKGAGEDQMWWTNEPRGRLNEKSQWRFFQFSYMSLNAKIICCLYVKSSWAHCCRCHCAEWGWWVEVLIFNELMPVWCPPPTDSFEVSVDGKLIYSKLQTGSFPDPSQVSLLLRRRSSFFFWK